MKRSQLQQIDFMRNLLAFLLCGAFVSVLAGLFFKAIPEANKDIITYMVGQLSGMALTVLGFYFVSKIGQEILDAKRAETSGKMADAVATALNATPPTSEAAAAQAAEETAEAAADKAKEFTGTKDGEPLE